MLPASDAVQDGKIVHLNDRNIEAILEDNQDDVWMVKFGAPWCKHCVNMKGDWKKSAKQLGGKVRFADIDVSENKAIAKSFGIKYLPEIKYFRGKLGKGESLRTHHFEPYSGKRSADDIITFAR